MNRTNIIPLAKNNIPQILEMYQESDLFQFIASHKDESTDYYKTLSKQQDRIKQRNVDGLKCILYTKT